MNPENDKQPPDNLGPSLIVEASEDPIRCLYGVYGLLEDHYGVGFYLGGDVLPDKKVPLVLPEVDERKAPAVGIRRFLPWTNFPQSAGVLPVHDGFTNRSLVYHRRHETVAF